MNIEETMPSPEHLRLLGAMASAWGQDVIGDTTREQHGLKICEETAELAAVAAAGRLARAIGCQSYGHRGTWEQWDRLIRKEAADVVIATSYLAVRFGFDLGAAAAERWDEIRSRTGGPRPPDDGEPADMPPIPGQLSLFDPTTEETR